MRITPNIPGRPRVFLVAYVAMAALSIPGATILTLVGGAIFGLVVGTILVSFASAIGATLAFLASRLLLRDWVQTKFGDRLAPVNAGIERKARFICLRCGSFRCFRFSSSIW